MIDLKDLKLGSRIILRVDGIGTPVVYGNYYYPSRILGTDNDIDGSNVYLVITKNGDVLTNQNMHIWKRDSNGLIFYNNIETYLSTGECRVRWIGANWDGNMNKIIVHMDQE